MIVHTDRQYCLILVFLTVGCMSARVESMLINMQMRTPLFTNVRPSIPDNYCCILHYSHETQGTYVYDFLEILKRTLQNIKKIGNTCGYMLELEFRGNFSDIFVYFLMMCVFKKTGIRVKEYCCRFYRNIQILEYEDMHS